MSVSISSPSANSTVTSPIQANGTAGPDIKVRGSMTDSTGKSYDPTSIKQPPKGGTAWSMSFTVAAMNNPYKLKVWNVMNQGDGDEHDNITVNT